jgi:hypothetical protein
MIMKEKVIQTKRRRGYNEGVRDRVTGSESTPATIKILRTPLEQKI